MSLVTRFGLVVAMTVALAGAASATCIDFEAFEIRNHDGSIDAPWDSTLSVIENAAEDGFAAETPESGQKVGYGTSAFDGLSINDFNTIDWDKISGKNGVVAYLNFWVTDGTNFAIISSENDYRGTDFQTRQEWKIFEYDGGAGLDWLFDSGTGSVSSQYLQRDGVNVDLADLSDSIVLGGPGSPYPGYVGTGAPRAGFGLNLIFGDTQSNFVGDYHLENLTVDYDGVEYCAGPAPVPEPASLALLGMGLLGMAVRRKRNRA